jgi:hypothetical protein
MAEMSVLPALIVFVRDHEAALGSLKRDFEIECQKDPRSARRRSEYAQLNQVAARCFRSLLVKPLREWVTPERLLTQRVVLDQIEVGRSWRMQDHELWDSATLQLLFELACEHVPATPLVDSIPIWPLQARLSPHLPLRPKSHLPEAIGMNKDDGSLQSFASMLVWDATMTGMHGAPLRPPPRAIRSVLRPPRSH